MLLRRTVSRQPARSLLRYGQPSRSAAQARHQAQRAEDGLPQERGDKGGRWRIGALSRWCVIALVRWSPCGRYGHAGCKVAAATFHRPYPDSRAEESISTTVRRREGVPIAHVLREIDQWKWWSSTHCASPEVLVSGAVLLFAGASRQTFSSLEQEATTAEELLRLFSLGNAQRKVSGTKMNAESSRSHSIFSILLEVRRPFPP